LKDTVRFCGSAPLDRIPEIMANADLGVVPKRADSFGNEAYSTKIMEFMAQGVPAVVSRTKVDSYYFDDNEVRFFTSGDADALADAIISLAADPSLRQQLIAHGFEYVRKNGWATKKAEYLDLIDSLSGDRRQALKGHARIGALREGET
jgi:glycosyltransferase involved in cell wall biosynthesis